MTEVHESDRVVMHLVPADSEERVPVDKRTIEACATLANASGGV